MCKVSAELHLNNNLNYYHFCSQAELTIEGVDDKEEMRLTQVDLHSLSHSYPNCTQYKNGLTPEKFSPHFVRSAHACWLPVSKWLIWSAVVLSDLNGQFEKLSLFTQQVAPASKNSEMFCIMQNSVFLA